MYFKPALLRFKFDKFADLPSEVDESVYKVQTECNGNRWKLELYPGGERSAKTPGYVGVCLFRKDVDDESESANFELDTRFVTCVKDADGKNVVEKNGEFKFSSCKRFCFGDLDFIQRSRIIEADSNILKDGALYIDVTIQVKNGKDTLYQPPNALSGSQLKLLKSGDRSDASFNVGDTVLRYFQSILPSSTQTPLSLQITATLQTNGAMVQLRPSKM
jgi:hypothetical protein